METLLMRRAMKFLLCAALLLPLSACGGNRAANPVAMVRVNDDVLSCDALDDEMGNNEIRINGLRREIDRAHQNQLTNGLLGGYIGTSTSEDGSAAGVEIDAYTRRNTYLRQLSRKHRC